MISGISQRTVTAPDGSGAVVVTPRGELDLGAIGSLDSAVRSALAAAGSPPRLIIDLSDVDVLAPVVLGVLLDAQRRCQGAGGSLLLVVTTPEIGATLADTGVEPLFDVAAGLQDAMRRLSAG
ncbi:STAS domain-containing protein [Candidatus Poriferisodalis sp.]|uniref:STAS domain-containing protein n=1 Tax=Candidatus Poriferisodalis sp. TaxID=3101277 RepID=UPI003C6FAD29